MRFLTGLPFPALFQIPFIICKCPTHLLPYPPGMEFMGKSGRIFSGLMISLFFGAAMALLGIVAMFIRRWRQLTFFCNAPFVVMFSYYLFVFFILKSVWPQFPPRVASLAGLHRTMGRSKGPTAENSQIEWQDGGGCGPPGHRCGGTQYLGSK